MRLLNGQVLLERPSWNSRLTRALGRPARLFAGRTEHSRNYADVVRALVWFSTSVRMDYHGLDLRESATGQGAPFLHVYWRGLYQPNVAVNARTLVEPAIAECRVDAHQQYIGLARNYEIRQVKAEWIVSADVTSDVEPVEDDHGFAIDAIELHGDVLACIGGGMSKTRRYHPTLVSGYLRPRG